jgi:hypothetical protein
VNPRCFTIPTARTRSLARQRSDYTSPPKREKRPTRCPDSTLSRKGGGEDEVEQATVVARDSFSKPAIVRIPTAHGEEP